MTETASTQWQRVRDPVSLLAEYRPGDFVFATGEHTMLAGGVGRRLPGADVDQLDQQLLTVFAESSLPIAVGVVPFAAGTTAPTSAALIVPNTFAVASPAHPVLRARTESRAGLGTPASVRAIPDESGHMAAVASALERLRAGDLRKVVLARALDISFCAEIDPARVLRNLIVDNPGGYTFAAPLPAEAGRERTLVGSSPELLVRRRGATVVAHPQAGTAPRSADPATDRRNGQELLASAKDQAEHALVVEAVVDALRPYCCELDVPSAPSLTSTSAVWHLGTKITGKLRSTEVSSLRLAAALHPTPAVCGTPTSAARDLLVDLEPFDRGYYAGAVGWVDAAGDGEWAVAIRCAEVAGTSLRLYAGGGIVPASDPAAELDETSAKFATLLRAMGVELTL